MNDPSANGRQMSSFTPKVVHVTHILILMQSLNIFFAILPRKIKLHDLVIYVYLHIL